MGSILSDDLWRTMDTTWDYGKVYDLTPNRSLLTVRRGPGRRLPVAVYSSSVTSRSLLPSERQVDLPHGVPLVLQLSVALREAEVEDTTATLGEGRQRIQQVMQERREQRKLH